MILSSLLYVDDALDLSTTLTDRHESHDWAVLFTKLNNLSLSGTKCFEMALNVDEAPPSLVIDELKKVLPTDVIVYLGDLFNRKGNNDDLIQDRVKRGTKASICISALVKESYLGKYEISVWLLLYHSLFLSTILFNSQAWSKLRVKDLEKLQVLQLKFLKKAVGVASSTPNSFLYLELGILPIEAEIHKRQIMFLHRILLLPDNDPVRLMLTNMMELHDQGETNWWTQVKILLPKYGLPTELDAIKILKKETLKQTVIKSIKRVVLEDLIRECNGLKKTADIRHKT